jgi:hypothetical protein
LRRGENFFAVFRQRVRFDFFGRPLGLTSQGFLSFFAVIVIDIAVLAHSGRIEFLMPTFPRFFDPTVPVVAITAHPLGVVRFALMSTVVDLLSE